jgi:hypothetical protein
MRGLLPASLTIVSLVSLARRLVNGRNVFVLAGSATPTGILLVRPLAARISLPFLVRVAVVLLAKIALVIAAVVFSLFHVNLPPSWSKRRSERSVAGHARPEKSARVR